MEITSSDVSRTTRIAAGLAAAGGLLAGYAFLVEPRWLQLTRPVIRVPGLHPGLEGLRIALLTDLHLGEGTPASLVRRACRMAMAERPHLIAVTGDLAGDHAPGFARALRALGELEAPLGVYAVPGNHDHFVGIDAFHRQVAADPVIEDLTNRFVVRTLRGGRVCIAGVDDLGEGRPALAGLPPVEQRDFTVLLAHNPDQADRARTAHEGVDLVLSGHLHGGQVRLPGIGALRRPSGQSDRHDTGLEPAAGARVYTSRGVGTVRLPVRFLCRPEVAVLRLTGSVRDRGGP
jgi:uncharacterized protein